MKLLSIQIPTIIGREQQFAQLMTRIHRQMIGHEKDVELFFMQDNKEISIGEKRQLMYERSNGLFSVQIDDDDDISLNYISSVLKALKSPNIKEIDCITYQERCHIQYGRRMFIKSVNHSIIYSRWMDNVGGFDHVRTPFCKDVIRTELAIKAGVPDIRFNEDEQFSINLLPLLRDEIHIDDYLYIYKYSNAISPAIKYGMNK